MENDNDNEMLEAAQELRAMTNNQTEVSVSRRLTLWHVLYLTEPKWDYLIIFGDVMNRGPWKWECAQNGTLDGALEIARKQITTQGDERARELHRLKESAEKLGLKLVEAAS